MVNDEEEARGSELATVAETMPVKDGGRDARDEGVNYARWGQARYVVNHLRLFFA